MNNHKPSPTELIILKALWERNPLSAREIHDQTHLQLQWSYSSTRKTLDRLHEKGYLKVDKSHGIKVYSPLVSKVSTLASFVNDFAKRVLEVNQPLPVSMFADSQLLDADELAELEALLQMDEQS